MADNQRPSTDSVLNHQESANLIVDGPNRSDGPLVKQDRHHPSNAPKPQVNTPALREKRKLPLKKRATARVSQWTGEWFTDWWGAEIISWLFAALSLAAIIITLEAHNGKPLPEWPFSITINALVSIFATIGEMAMMKPVTECLSQLKWLWFGRRRPLTEFDMFDDASRGRMGSLKLFIKLRGLHLASLGAAITIITLAFGPFTQQVLTYPSKLKASGTASASQVVGYTGNADSKDGQLDPQILSSVYTGLSTTDASFSSILTSCPTGNCTFPLYSSLGICATVTDVSEYLVELPCNQSLYESRISDSTDLGYLPGVPCFDYTLLGQGNNNVSFSYGDSHHDGATYLQLSPSNGPLGHTTVTGTVLANFWLLYQPLINLTANPNLLDFDAPQNLTQPPLALECELSFCAHTYSTMVNSTNTKTVLTSSKVLNYTSTSGENITATTNGVNFSVSGSDTVFLGIFPSLEATFTGSCVASFPEGEKETDVVIVCVSDDNNDGAAQAPVDFANDGVAQAALNFALAINGSSNPRLAVENVMNNLSVVMTNQLRQGAGGDATISQVFGTAYSMETYVHAEYLWLILPISLVFLTLILLIATISKSRRAKTEIWKASALAALQGLDPALHARLGRLRAMGKVERTAEGLEVRIVMDGNGGWSLVRE